MSILGLTTSAYLMRMASTLRHVDENPQAAQVRALGRLIARGQGTRFGRDHGLASVRTSADFARAVPVRSYAQQIELFQRVVHGEPDLLWPGKVGLFARTSGTTGPDKLIPVTPAMLRSCHRAALAALAGYGQDRWRKLGQILEGRMLFLGGSPALAVTPGGARVGDMSGILSGQALRWPLRGRVEPTADIAILPDWDQKSRRIVRRSADQDIRMLTGMPNWVRGIFEQICAARRQQRRGGISRVWPMLQLYMHWGMVLDPYKPMLDEFFEPAQPIDYFELYPASEGFFACQARPGEPGLRLLLDNGIYFEFVPLCEHGSDKPTRLGLEDVQVGPSYALVISTCSGLWGYDLGDAVRFVSLRPPRVVFAGRCGRDINAFGEKLSQEQAASALSAAESACGAAVRAFCVGPRFPTGPSPACHQYVVEFVHPPADLAAFAAAIDAHLRHINRSYDAKRAGNVGIGPPRLQAVPPGTFARWLARHGQRGPQQKVPVCSVDGKIIRELLTLAGAGE